MYIKSNLINPAEKPKSRAKRKGRVGASAKRAQLVNGLSDKAQRMVHVELTPHRVNLLELRQLRLRKYSNIQRPNPEGALVLNNTERDRFIDAIENPAPPSEALLAVAVKYGYR